jgi:protein-tyrosine phosphatase
MIDIHTHILPHIDDGAKDSQMSLEICRAELAQGVDTIVLTPHYYGKKRSPQQFLEKRAECFEHIQAKLPEGLSVRLGAEVHFTGLNMPKAEELCQLAIEDTKYILFEFPFTTLWTGDLFDKVRDFICDTSYTPIIAHVERYHEVLKNPALVSDLVRMGCLIQVNTSAFLEKSTKKFALALLKHGLVHCLGTDTHNAGERAPDYAAAKAVVEEAGLGESWNEIQENMQKILADEYVELFETKPVKKIFGVYI